MSLFVLLRHIPDDMNDSSKFGMKIDIIKKDKLPLHAMFIRYHLYMEEYVVGGSLDERLLFKKTYNEL